MTQSNTPRIAYLDLLRVLATLAVIYIHVNADGLLVMDSQYDWYVAMVGGSLVRWAVPVFVMISGALYLNPQKSITTETVLKRKIPRLLLAYVAWWVIYATAIVLVWVVIKKEPLQTDWLRITRRTDAAPRALLTLAFGTRFTQPLSPEIMFSYSLVIMTPRQTILSVMPQHTERIRIISACSWTRYVKKGPRRFSLLLWPVAGLRKADLTETVIRTILLQ